MVDRQKASGKEWRGEKVGRGDSMTLGLFLPDTIMTWPGLPGGHHARCIPIPTLFWAFIFGPFAPFGWAAAQERGKTKNRIINWDGVLEGLTTGAIQKKDGFNFSLIRGSKNDERHELPMRLDGEILRYGKTHQCLFQDPSSLARFHAAKEIMLHPQLLCDSTVGSRQSMCET